MERDGGLLLRYACESFALWERIAGEQAPDAFLLVHGLGQHRATYTRGPMPDRLARAGRVFLVELDGPSRSSPSRALGLSAYADVVDQAVAMVLEQPGVERVHYVGHSMGAYLGYILAARGRPIASLAVFGAPWPVASGRPQIRWAAQALKLARRGVERSEARGPATLPLRTVLRWVSNIATARPGGVSGSISNLVRLGHPEEASREHLKALLEDGVSEGWAVLEDLAGLALSPQLVGIDLEKAVNEAKLPIFSALGDHDVFGSRQELSGGVGPRRTILVEGSAHSDIVMGRRSGALAEELVRFLRSSGVLRKEGGGCEGGDSNPDRFSPTGT